MHSIPVQHRALDASAAAVSSVVAAIPAEVLNAKAFNPIASLYSCAKAVAAEGLCGGGGLLILQVRDIDMSSKSVRLHIYKLTEFHWPSIVSVAKPDERGNNRPVMMHSCSLPQGQGVIKEPGGPCFKPSFWLSALPWQVCIRGCGLLAYMTTISVSPVISSFRIIRLALLLSGPNTRTALYASFESSLPLSRARELTWSLSAFLCKLLALLSSFIG